MRKLLVVMSVLAVVFMSGCVGGETTPTTTGPSIAQLQNIVNDLDTNLTNLAQKVNAIKDPTADITSIKNDINTIKNDITGVKANITALQSTPNGITQAQLNSAITAATSPLQAKIDTLTAEIAALKAGPTGTQNQPLITANLRYLFPSIAFTATFPSATAVTGQFRLDITNNSATLLKDVQFVIYFVPSLVDVAYAPAPTLTSAVTMGTTPILWQYGGIQSGALMFANGLGFNLNANETKSLTLTLSVNSAATATVQYTPYVFVGMS